MGPIFQFFGVLFVAGLGALLMSPLFFWGRRLARRGRRWTGRLLMAPAGFCLSLPLLYALGLLFAAVWMAFPRNVFIRAFGTGLLAQVEDIESEYSAGTDFESIHLRFKEKESALLALLAARKSHGVFGEPPRCAFSDAPSWWTPVDAKHIPLPGKGQFQDECEVLILSADGYLFYRYHGYD